MFSFSAKALRDLQALREQFRDRLVVFEDSLEPVDARIIESHLAHLRAICTPLLLEKLVARGFGRILLGSGPCAAFPGYHSLAQLQVPWRQRGLDYSRVPCAYDWQRKDVLLGTRPLDQVEGATAPAIHEMAHALGDLFGYDDDYRVLKEYERLRPYLPPLLHSALPRPPRHLLQEFFSQSVEHVIISTHIGKRVLSEEYRDRFVRRVVLRGGPALSRRP